MAKLKMSDESVRQAWGRVLTDRYHPGDGKILMASLESVLRATREGMSNPCALQEHEGRRSLARILIDIADEAQEQTSDGSDTITDDSTGERRDAPTGVRRGRRSRRRLAGSAG